jgi:hypothetical protein
MARALDDSAGGYAWRQDPLMRGLHRFPDWKTLGTSKLTLERTLELTLIETSFMTQYRHFVLLTPWRDLR